MRIIKEIGYFLGVFLTIFAVYKLDLVLIEGLNYFGKYVFFGLFHLIILYSFYYAFKFKNWKKFIPLIEGVFFSLVNFSLGVLV